MKEMVAWLLRETEYVEHDWRLRAHAISIQAKFGKGWNSRNIQPFMFPNLSLEKLPEPTTIYENPRALESFLNRNGFRFL